MSRFVPDGLKILEDEKDVLNEMLFCRSRDSRFHRAFSNLDPKTLEKKMNTWQEAIPELECMAQNMRRLVQQTPRLLNLQDGAVNLESIYSYMDSVDYPDIRKNAIEIVYNFILTVLTVASVSHERRHHFSLYPSPEYASQRYVHPFSGNWPTVYPLLMDERTKNVCLYHAFFSKVLARHHKRVKKYRGPGDSIISLNYDLLIESKLACFSQQNFKVGGSKTFSIRGYPHEVDGYCVKGFFPSYRRPREQPDRDSDWILRYRPFEEKRGSQDNLTESSTWNFPKLFKYHGSISWLADTPSNDAFVSPVSNVVDTIISTSLDGASLRKNNSSIRQIPGETPHPITDSVWPIIVPPSWRRDIKRDSLIGRVQSMARRELRTAGRIVIIGYSFPPTDSYVRHVLAEALDSLLPPKVEVWTYGDEEHEQKMRENLATQLTDRLANGIKVYRTGLRGFVENYQWPPSL